MDVEFSDEELRLPAFEDVWFTNDDSRYRVAKGGRMTGKTFDFIGLEEYFKIFSDPRRNILNVRQNDKDNAQSNFTILKNVAHRYGIAHLFKFTQSPHKITYKRTGQVILFAGMNDVENITGTSVETGYWTDIYFEEASQLKSYEEFRVVDGSLRVPNYEPDLKPQITFLFNAWDVGHWLYDVFFKGRLEDDVATLETVGYQYYRDPEFNIGNGDGLSLHISSYKCNPYVPDDRVRGIRRLRELAYDIYKVEALGCWGNLSDRTYSHWDDGLVFPAFQAIGRRYDALAVGIDFGMSDGQGRIKYGEKNARKLGSANAMELIGVSGGWSDVEVLDEYFDSNEGRPEQERKSSVRIQREMVETLAGWIRTYEIRGTLVCYVDCADPGGFIDGLVYQAKEIGLRDVLFRPATKIAILSRVYFENTLMAYGCLRVSSNGKNLVREVKSARKAPDGRVREDVNDHAINAFEYAWIPIRKRLVRWKGFKDPLKSEADDV